MDWDPAIGEFLINFHIHAASASPNSQSVPSLTGSPPDAQSVASGEIAIGDFGRLLWAPHKFRPGTEPLLRFFVESSPDSTTIQNSIKYLALGKIQGQRHKYNPHFFTAQIYKDSEPFPFVRGAWNHAHVSFTKELATKDVIDDDGEVEEYYYISANISDETYVELPKLDPRAIWTDKPVVEYVSLKRTEINLRVPTPGRVSDRIGVVRHKDFDDHKTKMVMKIWPTPKYDERDIETEMRAYRACDGKDITPKFLGHVAEEGRIIGMLIEYIEGAHKPSNDDEKALCRQALARFHELTGWHRNPMANHKGNFLIKDGRVYIIDLSRAWTPEAVASRKPGWVTETV